MTPRAILPLAAVFFLQTLAAQTPAKIAFLVGVGQYPQTSGWLPFDIVREAKPKN